ncbi:hypothetical protein XENTR_v10003795 [Xenopus tropicalis]|nr:hypothetical protein XENTR_v10003795 [Xenopus tropicalis]
MIITFIFCFSEALEGVNHLMKESLQRGKSYYLYIISSIIFSQTVQGNGLTVQDYNRGIYRFLKFKRFLEIKNLLPLYPF